MDKSGIFVGITVGSVSVFIIFSALFIIPMGTDETTKQMQNISKHRDGGNKKIKRMDR